MIAVYGNLIIDEIVDVKQPITLGTPHECTTISRLGGIANFGFACQPDDWVAVSAINQFDKPLMSRLRCKAFDIQLRHENTSKAIVLADRQANQRTGFVEWGACRQRNAWSPVPADWHHIMYLDRLDIDLIKFAKQAIGPISVDFCDSNEIPKYFDALQYVDYLFASNLEVINPPFKWNDVPVKKLSIVHSPALMFSWGFRHNCHTHFCAPAAVPNLNVVGAGDYFAAYSIANLIQDGRLDLEHVHKATLALLQRQS